MPLTNDCDGLAFTAKFLATDKGMADVLASSDVLLRIQGYPELTFTISTNAMPRLKNDILEYTLPTGLKTDGVSRNQTLQNIPITSNERSDHLVNDTLDVIMMGGDNGKLIVDFYTGNGDIRDLKPFATVEHGTIKVDEGMEGDAEGTTSPMKQSYALSGHYFPCNPKKNEAASTAAAEALADLTS